MRQNCAAGPHGGLVWSTPSGSFVLRRGKNPRGRGEHRFPSHASRGVKTGEETTRQRQGEVGKLSLKPSGRLVFGSDRLLRHSYALVFFEMEVPVLPPPPLISWFLFSNTGQQIAQNPMHSLCQLLVALHPVSLSLKIISLALPKLRVQIMRCCGSPFSRPSLAFVSLSQANSGSVLKSYPHIVLNWLPTRSGKYQHLRHPAAALVFVALDYCHFACAP